MDIDFEVLDAAISFAVANPDEFNMDVWFRRDSCGTTACLAGAIARQAGYQPAVWYSNDRFGWDGATHVQLPDDQLPDDTADAVWNVAARLLGLDPYEDGGLLDGLFFAADIDEVIAIRNRLARKAGVAQRTWDVPSAVTS